mgnify:CR=1 FL=1
MKKLNMYIPVRDQTTFMIKYYQYLFNKYWSTDMNVYYLGYKVPDVKLEKNHHFISLAESRPPEPKGWSTKIVDFMQSIDDEFFHFQMEDQLIIRPVDLELIDACEDILDQSIGRIDLCNSVQYDPGRRGYVHFYKEHKGVRFLVEDQNPPGSVYRVSCSNSIWNRNWFLKTLEKNFSTTDWEVAANDGRNNNDGYDVLSTINRWTPAIVHSLSRYWNDKINLQGMLEEDVLKFKEMSSEEEISRFKYDAYPSDGSSVVNLEGYQPNESQKFFPNIN